MSSIQGSTVPSPSGTMVIDIGPPATEEEPTEQPKQPEPQPSACGAPEASPKAKRRGRPARGKAQSSKPRNDGSNDGKKIKTQTPRKPPAKRAKKSNAATEDEPPADPTCALPSPRDSPKATPPKQAASRHAGRQHAGPYTREEVRALQNWVNNTIRDDWNTIAQEVGKATGVYRHIDSLRTFYGTVVLRQMYDAFPDKNGEHGTIVAVDVGIGDGGDGGGSGELGKVCGNCRAILIDGREDKDVKEEVALEDAEDWRPTAQLMQIETELAEEAIGN
ncbi:hypothetical protein L211DRAFT_850181 [Terfezia boudieri ATCC MYA-4762]|uniref:Myb-like domain-containing protein n=1 Tax=Terfezia boudieri ATCC MYA-4762 TaxID=1051890 RepID=A0A3N4LND0_9PEZI|nr:hypothetical protein L211DRAFT_850181 [Terfezia boudieri ATCC MYA-4762]